MMDRSRRPEAGFSLVELIVAMAVTLIVAGAVFGLMTAGQSAFRREPELIDRQQNIRIAMKLIETDLATAGMGMPSFIRTFTPGLDGAGPTGPQGTATDFLELFGNDGLCPDLAICGNQAPSAANVFTSSLVPDCYQLPGIVMFSDDTQWAIKWSCTPGSGQTHGCGGGGGGDNGHITFPPGSSPIYNSPGGLGFDAQTASAIQMVRYEIRIDAENVPNLWRSPTGGLVPPSGGQCKAGGAAATDGFILVARGIEDLQVQYRTNAGWADEPPAAVAGPNDIVREVGVTLSSRVTAQNLAGESTSATGTAVRGQLTSSVSPRAALQALMTASPAPQWQ